MSYVIIDNFLFIMLLDGKHGYAARDIKQRLFNSCINKILLNIKVEILDY